MVYSIGIWAVAQGDGVVRYRWESDAGGHRRTGFVVLDERTSVVHPSDEEGMPIGTLTVAVDGGLIGEADVDRRQFSQIAAAILRDLKRNGSAPQTAHRYYGSAGPARSPPDRPASATSMTLPCSAAPPRNAVHRVASLPAAAVAGTTNTRRSPSMPGDSSELSANDLCVSRPKVAHVSIA